MNLQLNKAHYPVTVLGYGKRIGIWFQGCSAGCEGCISRDTWPKEAGRRVAIDTLVAWCREVTAGELDGITISGGEPLEQPRALERLLEKLRSWTDPLPQQVDYLCYTGLHRKRVENGYTPILRHLDAIIAGPYVHKLPTAPLRGSSNQELVCLTELGRERYGSPGARWRKAFQIQVDEGCIWFIGIPEKGDMERFEQQCRARGVELGEVSWRS